MTKGGIVEKVLSLMSKWLQVIIVELQEATQLQEFEIPVIMCLTTGSNSIIGTEDSSNYVLNYMKQLNYRNSRF
jgi:hypothetical protein